MTGPEAVQFNLESRSREIPDILDHLAGIIVDHCAFEPLNYLVLQPPLSSY